MAVNTGKRISSNELNVACNCKTKRRKPSAIRAGSFDGGMVEPSLNTPRSIPAEKCLPVEEITMTRASLLFSISRMHKGNSTQKALSIEFMASGRENCT